MRTFRKLALSLTALGACAVGLSGCQVFGIASVMAKTWEETGESTIPAQYEGLMGKYVAVIVYTDPATAMDQPDLITRLTQNVSLVLVMQQGLTAGVIDPIDVRKFQVENPGWAALSFGEIAKRLNAERLVWVEVHEHRLHEPGNTYTWSGRLSGRVGVVEAPTHEDDFVDDFAFERQVHVQYPDEEGYTPTDITAASVRAVLEKRFVDRVTWLFYEHVEKNAIEY